MSKKLQFTIRGAEPDSCGGTPLTFGVPFAQGELPAAKTIRVRNDAGERVPVQTHCMTTWQPDGGGVKWLLVDMQDTAATAAAEETMMVEYPVDANATPAPGQEIEVTQTPNEYVIDTGPLRVAFRHSFRAWQQPHDSAVISKCSLKTASGRQDIVRGAGPVLYMTDQYGNYYDSQFSRSAPSVVIEEQGPLRVCVLIKGFLASAQGARFCPYQLRIHLYAGKSDLRMFHTFVFDQDPRSIELGSIGLSLPLDLGDNLRAAVGGDDNGEAHWCTNWEELAFLQRDDRNYEVRRNGDLFGSGGRAPGWATLCGSDASAAVAIRDSWQEYPKGFMLDKDGIDIQIWPEACGRTLAFTTPFEEPALRFAGISKDGQKYDSRDEQEVVRRLAENPTAPLNLKSFNIRSIEDARRVEAMIEKHAADRTMSYNDTGTETGLGAAKTTEIVIRLAPDQIADRDAQRFATAVQSPRRAVVDPQYLCATGALGHFYPAGDPRFRQEDADLDDNYNTIVVDPVERCRLFGMMRYGNMVCVHSSAVGWVYLLYRDTAPEKALRYIGPYNNEANDQVMALWGHFISTGDPGYRRIAERYSRTVADVAFVHADPGRPERVGLMHYHNAHQWSGGLSPSHSIMTGILTDYYMTGNRRLLDVAREAGDRIVNTQEAAGILSCRNGMLHREFTGPLSILLDIYQATWAEKYGRLAERSLNWMLRLIRTPGRMPNGIWTSGRRGDEAHVTPEIFPEVAWGNKYHLYEPALRLFPSKALEDFLIAEADYWVWESPKDLLNYASTTVCFGYDLTGKPEYAYYAANLCSGNLHDFVEGTRNGKHLDLASMRFNGYVPRLLRIVATEMERSGTENFKAGLAAWREKRNAMPDRPEQVRPDAIAPESLGVLSTEPQPLK